MEQLRESLVLNNAVVEDWTHRNTEKGLKVHFMLSSALDRRTAEILGCEYMLSGEGAPSSATLDAELKETELLLPIPASEDHATLSVYPDVVYKFRTAKEDERIALHCRVHVSSRMDELHEVLKGIKTGVEVVIRPRQGLLFDGGTRVDMSGTPEATGETEAAAGETKEPAGETPAEAKAWPKPDENGLYDPAAAECIRYERKGADVCIRVLEVERGWLYAVTCKVRGQGFEDPLSDKGMLQESRDEAVIAGAEDIAQFCYSGGRDSGWSKADQQVGRAAGQWAQNLAEFLTSKLEDGDKEDEEDEDEGEPNVF